MRHLVRVEPEWKVAEQLDSRPGGPGALFREIGERYRPEVFYVEAARRAAWWVIDFADAAALTEFTHLMVAKTGAYPTITPVLTADEAPGAIGKAIQRARGAT